MVGHGNTLMPPSIEYLANAALAPRDVVGILDHTDWARGRDEDGVAAMLRGGLAHVSAHEAGELIGFARAFGDGVYRALIEDVVVRADRRGTGIGHWLVDLLLDQLADVEEVVLFCDPAREGFYEAHGFKRHLVTGMQRFTRGANG